MTGGPVVSVLLPVRDAEPWIDPCARSLQAQTFDDFEVLVVDDGSSDGSVARVEGWASRDGRVRLLRQERLGLVAALERARAEARGRYLARMDADDVAHPGRLARQLELMEREPGLAGCGCLIEYFPGERVRGGARRYERWINAVVTPEEVERDFFVECPLPHPTFFLRAEAVSEVGGYRDAGWPEDYDLLLRLRERGGRFQKVPELLLRWREHEGRLSRTHSRYSPEAFRRCKAHFLLRDDLEHRPAVVWGAGPTGKAFATTLLSAGGRLAAFVDLDPRKIGQTIRGAPVVSPSEVPLGGEGFVLAAVGQPGAREEIRAALRELGLVETVDFRAVA